MTDERQSRREQAIANICRKLLGETQTRIEFPGGRSRKTAIVYCGDAIYAVSRRGSVQRAVLEAAVLKQLFELGVPVPRLIASEDHWTIQEYLGDIRLSQGLDKAGPADRLKLMTMAVQGLAQIQDAGRQAGLVTKVATIGRRKEWLEKFIAAPRQVSALIAVPPPELNASALFELLSVPTPAFIK